MGYQTSASFKIRKNSEVQSTIVINIEYVYGKVFTGNVITSLNVENNIHIRMN